VKTGVLSIDDAAWSDFVAGHPQATLFHHPAWSRLIADCYGYRPFAVTVQSDTGEIRAGVPLMELKKPFAGRRWVALPFSDYCGPLADDARHMADLIAGLRQLGARSGIDHVEIRSSLPGSRGAPEDCHYVLHTLPLQPDPAAVYETFAKKFRQYPRKAERDGLRLAAPQGRRDMYIFYELHVKVRRKLGVPVQPKRFFDMLWDRLIAGGLGQVLIVTKDGVPVSGAVALHFNRRAMIKYSASDPSALSLRCHYYSFWKCIEWACHAGCRVIDFGRTDRPDEGLRHFKNGWGTTEQPLAYSFLGLSGRHSRVSVGKLSEAARAVLQRSPAWVCRATGELLYKYAG
jgi:CelD/BcsL family acetyltransferase involved in cellulose biosynthesis